MGVAPAGKIIFEGRKLPVEYKEKKKKVKSMETAIETGFCSDL